MKLIGYTVDLSFSNTPRVDARVAVTDPVTGEERTELISFFDDDARVIVAMVPNPVGVGLVVDPDGKINHAALRSAVTKRTAEVSGGGAASTLAARVAAAEAARKTAHEAEQAAKAAEEARAAATAAKAALDAEIAQARAAKAQLDAEIEAAKKAKAAPAEGGAL